MHKKGQGGVEALLYISIIIGILGCLWLIFSPNSNQGQGNVNNKTQVQQKVKTNAQNKSTEQEILAQKQFDERVNKAIDAAKKVGTIVFYVQSISMFILAMIVGYRKKKRIPFEHKLSYLDTDEKCQSKYIFKDEYLCMFAFFAPVYAQICFAKKAINTIHFEEKLRSDYDSLYRDYILRRTESLMERLPKDVRWAHERIRMWLSTSKDKNHYMIVEEALMLINELIVESFVCEKYSDESIGNIRKNLEELKLVTDDIANVDESLVLEIQKGKQHELNFKSSSILDALSSIRSDIKNSQAVFDENIKSQA